MSASGPTESYIGDPLWSSLSEWADACRKREGLVVGVHFPYPVGELAADIVLGKIDAVELNPLGQSWFSLALIMDWYRYLNCGYRLPAVGGTDKMGAYKAVGANRTYAYLGNEKFNFQSWAKAVRQGNTFMSTGPLVLLQVEGHAPGDEIPLGAGGASLEVQVEATSYLPFHRLEVVLNGQVVASREEAAGTRRMVLKERVSASGPGWLAARCSSRLGPVAPWHYAVAAHTSPVYLRVRGRELFSPQVATYLLELVDGAQFWVENLAIRPDADRLERILSVFKDARAVLKQRMAEHGRQDG